MAFVLKVFGRTLELSSELDRLKKGWLRVTPRCIIFESSSLLVHHDQTTNSAVTRVSGRIGDVVIDADMNHQSAAIAVEYRGGTGGKRNRVGLGFQTARAVFCPEHILEIPR